MITYTSGGAWYLLKVFQVKGSVFPSALLVALPCTAFAAVLKILIDAGHMNVFASDDSILSETQAWSGFSFFVGFLVVFRTSQAYSRFWDGSSATHRMRAEWFDACSSLIAFCKHAKAENSAISKFQNTLVRLFSMLHACALAELEVLNADFEDANDALSYKFDLIDPEGFDEESLELIMRSDSKVELIFSWIQFHIVENIGTGVLSIPPPILSRSFQEIANGMVAFHEAIKIAYIPFPFPYAQTCDCLLILHWLVIPFVVSQWVTSPIWAGVFTFMQVFILWSLNFIAVEIENPFGMDDNDLDGHHMQGEMNRHLILLLSKSSARVPRLQASAEKIEEVTNDNVRLGSFAETWAEMRAARTTVMVNHRKDLLRHRKTVRGSVMRRFPTDGRPSTLSISTEYRRGSSRSAGATDSFDVGKSTGFASMAGGPSYPMAQISEEADHHPPADSTAKLPEPSQGSSEMRALGAAGTSPQLAQTSEQMQAALHQFHQVLQDEEKAFVANGQTESPALPAVNRGSPRQRTPKPREWC